MVHINFLVNICHGAYNNNTFLGFNLAKLKEKFGHRLVNYCIHSTTFLANFHPFIWIYILEHDSICNETFHSYIYSKYAIFSNELRSINIYEQAYLCLFRLEQSIHCYSCSCYYNICSHYLSHYEIYKLI